MNSEVALKDRCDELDKFSDAALADQLVTAWAERIGKPDFARLVDAFGRLRSEGGATGRGEPRCGSNAAERGFAGDPSFDHIS